MQLRFQVALVVVLAQLSTGCATVVGIGLGAGIDTGSPSMVSLDGTAVVTAGTRIRVHLRNGKRVDGRYAGEQYRREEYSTRYAAHRDPALPELGTRVIVHLDKGPSVEGTWQGFDPNLLVLESEDGGQARVPMGHVADVAIPSGRALPGKFLRALAHDGALPYRSRLTMDAQSYGLEEVLTIERARAHTDTGKTVGAILGAALDTMLIIAFSAHNY